VGIESLPTFYSHWYTGARSVQQVTLLVQHEALQGGVWLAAIWQL
jgi:hypothetical protein